MSHVRIGIYTLTSGTAQEVAASWVAENLAGKVQLEDTQVGDFLFYESA